jgi:hypothetical protein
MNFESIKLIWKKDLGTNRFSNWIYIRILTNVRKKELVKFLETNLGPLGEKWQYQILSGSELILKLNDDRDLLFFLLKLK